MTKLPVINRVKTVAKSRLFDIEEVELHFSNGTRAFYERLAGTGTGGVLVVPLVRGNMILLVREYSVGFERYELGFVKGRIENGESAEAAAVRELREEIGFDAKQLRLLTSVSLWPNYSPFQTFIFLASSLYESPLAGDEPEELETLSWPIENLASLRNRDDFTDARCLLATYLIEEKASIIDD